MAELCGFCWKSIFSKVSCGSEDIIQNIPLESKQMTDYCFKKVKAVSQGVFWQMAGVWIFYENVDPIFLQFFVNKRTHFFSKKLSWLSR